MVKLAIIAVRKGAFIKASIIFKVLYFINYFNAMFINNLYNILALYSNNSIILSVLYKLFTVRMFINIGNVFVIYHDTYIYKFN